MTEEQAMWVDVICTMVADGSTILDVSKVLGCSVSTVVARATCTPEAAERYARARDASSDALEAEIMAAARNVDRSNANAERVKIDALKWVAAKRAPKRFGERAQVDHTSSDGSMTPKAAAAPLDLSKLSTEALEELAKAMAPDAD